MWITVNCCGLLFLKRNLIEITIQRFYKKKPAWQPVFLYLLFFLPSLLTAKKDIFNFLQALNIAC